MNREQKSGCFFAYDKNERRLKLEWNITDILSSALAEFKKEVSELASEITAQSELEFLQSNPEAAARGGFLKSCQSLFINGTENVDWIKAKEILQSSIDGFYRMDLMQFGPAIITTLKDDVYFFASVKDMQSDTLLGFIMTAITPALPQGTMKLINLVVNSNGLCLWIEELLLGSIIKVFPDMECIFTMIRPTNNAAIARFELYGFSLNTNPVQDPNHPLNTDFLVLECHLRESILLQKAAHLLIE